MPLNSLDGMRRFPVRQRLHHPKQYSSPFSLPNILIVVCVLVFGWTLYRASTLAPAQQEPSRADQQPTGAFLPGLEQLYGPKEGLWLSSGAASGGPSQLLVLSYWNSRASLAARLLMLLGVYAGEASQLRIGAKGSSNNCTPVTAAAARVGFPG